MGIESLLRLGSNAIVTDITRHDNPVLGLVEGMLSCGRADHDGPFAAQKVLAEFFKISGKISKPVEGFLGEPWIRRPLPYAELLHVAAVRDPRPTDVIGNQPKGLTKVELKPPVATNEITDREVSA